MIPDALMSDPYSFIVNYYDSIYPISGRKIFSVLALSPVSLIMPKIPRENKSIKNKINVFVLGNPGGGKSSISDEFEKIAYNPLRIKDVTPARLNLEVMNKTDSGESFSLIIDDVNDSLSNEIIVKMLESILGEESNIGHATFLNKSEETTTKVSAIAYLSGTPDNLNKKIREGLLFRCFSITLVFTDSQHREIINKISNSMNKDINNNCQESIKEYYDLIYSIQAGEHEKIEPIIGYEISEEIKKELSDCLKPMLETVFSRYNVSLARSVEDAYRIMCASAMLNLFNRKIENNKIFINGSDLELTKRIIAKDLNTKAMILHILQRFGSAKISLMLKHYEEQREVRRKQAQENNNGVIKIR